MCISNMETFSARKITEQYLENNADQYVLWVDNELCGYASSEEESKSLLSDISEKLAAELRGVNPHWNIECVKIDDTLVKVKCTNPGYVYNSRWTAHSVRRQLVKKLIIKEAENSGEYCVNTIVQNVVSSANARRKNKKRRQHC